MLAQKNHQANGGGYGHRQHVSGPDQGDGGDSRSRADGEGDFNGVLPPLPVEDYQKQRRERKFYPSGFKPDEGRD